ncbi:hypothetical protein K523DRAFT_417604 [Schizophyllum commune Tattone D]|nr:hypothetical protein K523DRAFT_417604 [Schizophyllum commune Tattone D]
MNQSSVIYTTNPADSDVRRMVVSPGMCDQSAKRYEDSLGRPYLQMPDIYALCFATTTSHIYNMCKATGVGFYGDRCFTIMKYFERLEDETGISLENGLNEVELKDGRLVYLAVIAMADTPEALPRPIARINKFKELLNTKKEPIVRRVKQPRMYST